MRTSDFRVTTSTRTVDAAPRRIRVLFVRPTLSQGGADKVTVTILQHLDRSKFEPHLALLRAEGEWTDQVPKDVGLHLLGVRRVRGMVPALVGLVRQIQPDVLFSTASGTNAIAVLVARLCGYRVAVSERNVILNGGMRPAILAQWGLKAVAYRFAHQVTAVSSGVADDMSRKLRLPRSQILALLNPSVNANMPMLAAAPLDHPWFQPGNATIVAAGRLVPWKGYPVLLKAFQRIHAVRPDARLVILGEGQEHDSLQQLTRQLRLQTVVDFVGFQKNPYAFFARAAAFALSSFNEGLPNVLIEAMACGAPAVATDCPPGMTEIISHGVDGFLVPVADDGALAACLLEVLNNPELAQQLSAAAKRSAQRFTVDAVVRNYEAAVMLASSN